MGRRVGNLSISPELLQQALGIECEILDARMNHFKGGWIELLVGSPMLPEQPEGSYPPPVNIEQLMKEKEDNNSYGNGSKERGEVFNLS